MKRLFENAGLYYILNRECWLEAYSLFLS